jgi:hypothetical protein
MDRGTRRGAALAATLAAVIGVGALAGSAAAAPSAVFASPTGSDTATNCTDQNTPCSLVHALSKAHDGDDLTVLTRPPTGGSSTVSEISTASMLC